MTQTHTELVVARSSTDLIETGAKLATLVIGLAYVSGLVLVNVYLASIGVVDYRVLQPAHAIVGAVFIGIVLCCSVSAAVSFISFRKRWNRASGIRGRVRSLGYAYTEGAAGLGTIVLVFCVVSYVPSEGFGGALWRGTVIYFLAAAFGLLVAESIRDLPITTGVLRKLVGLMTLLAVGAFLVSAYGRLVLPRLPEVLAGISPKPVQLLIRDDSSSADVLRLGIPLSTTPRLTDPISLVYDAGGQLIVKSDSGVIAIDRTLVRAVRIVGVGTMSHNNR